MENLQARVKTERVVGKHTNSEAVVHTKHFVSKIDSAVKSFHIGANADWKADECRQKGMSLKKIEECGWTRRASQRWMG